jgi:L-aminopeptidase/D-esterase-like protein
VGKLFGIERAMKGGIGGASLQVGAFTVGALVAVNAIGDVLDADGTVIAGARGPTASAWCEPANGCSPVKGRHARDGRHGHHHRRGRHRRALTKAQANKLASLAHHGLSRAVDPLTVNDGDTLFALATGTAGRAGDLSALGAMAAEVVARAIRNAVRAARGLSSPALPGAGDGPFGAT